MSLEGEIINFVKSGEDNRFDGRFVSHNRRQYIYVPDEVVDVWFVFDRRNKNLAFVYKLINGNYVCNVLGSIKLIENIKVKVDETKKARYYRRYKCFCGKEGVRKTIIRHLIESHGLVNMDVYFVLLDFNLDKSETKFGRV